MESATVGVGLEELLGKSIGLSAEHEKLLGAIKSLYHPSVHQLGKALDCDVNVIKRGIKELQSRRLVRERTDDLSGNWFYAVKLGESLHEAPPVARAADHAAKDPESYPCPECPKVLPTKVGRSIHMATIHKVHKNPPADEKRTWPCPRCDRKFSSETGVNIHIGQVHKDIDLIEEDELQDDEEPTGDPLLMKLKKIVDELEVKGFRVKVLIEVHYGRLAPQGAS